ncbi:MAG: GAF domain-containing protein [Lachnospiraceae bacterium]|jgi:L-methionine (R)-S-oxide reductase|nr:GAF domain-containing protein [Lachnospiraceae bacterium]
MDYKEINGRESIPDDAGTHDPIALLSNAAAVLKEEMEDVTWVGFFRVKGRKLVIGPYQGEIRISECPVGTGAKGIAARDDRTLAVPDVHAMAEYCIDEEDTRSVIAVPVHRHGRLYAILFLESGSRGRFTDADARGLEEFSSILTKQLDS